MAVNLRATATLNAKPFIAGIKTIQDATAKLNKTAISGSAAVKSGVLGEAAARETASKAVRSGTQAVTTATAASSKAMRQATTNAEAYGRALDSVQTHSRKVIDAYASMTPAAARHNKAVLDLSRAQVALATQQAQGLEGPALQKYQAAVDNAARAVGRARASIVADNEKVASTTQRAAEAQNLRNVATTKGIADARAYTQSLAGLSQEKLRLQAASERLGAAEARLASAMAKSNGAITPAVASARAGVLSAAAAYNTLSEAQANLGKGGPRAASGLAAQRYLFNDLSRQALTTSAILAAVPVTAIAVAASWEKSFADVVRTADPAFATMDNRVAALRSSMVQMVQTMPTSFSAVTEIATLANQMGIATSEVASFTQAVAMFSATSGVSVDMAATAFGRLKSILGTASIPFMEMSDAILKVGVNSVATESEIINITTQISSIAAQAGFSGKQMIALSGALASVRVPPELSRGVITRIFGQIDKAVSQGGTGLTNLARISGRTAEEFREQWGSDQAANLFNDFLRGLRNAGSGARAELQSLGITSVRDIPVTLRLANAADSEGREGELFTQTLRDANNAAGETQRQYTIMAETVVAKLKMLGNNLLAFFDALGSGSLGVFGDLLDNLSKGIRSFTRDIDEPAAIIGKAFGVSNGEALGLFMSIGLVVSGLTAAASAALKFGAVWRAVQHGKAVTGITSIISGLVGNLTSGTLAFGKFGKSATGAGAAMRGAAGSATGLLGGASRLAGVFGPIGLAIGAAATALMLWNQAAQANVTSSSDLAERLASINLEDAAQLNNALSNITVAGPDKTFGWELNTKPFESGVGDLKSAVAELTRIREANQYDWFGGKQTFAIGEWLDRAVQGMGDESEGLKIFGDSIQELVDSGNTAKAIQLIRSLKLSGEELSNIMTLDEGKNIKGFLQNAFDAAGIEMTAANLDKLAKNQLPEVTDALYGVTGAAKAMDEVFDGDTEGLGNFVAKIDEAAASFLDLNSAVEAATKTNENGAFESFSLGDFATAMQSQLKEQEQWINDIAVISKHGSTAVVESLADLGPAGKNAARELAAGLSEGTPAALQALQTMEDLAVAKAGGLGSAIAEAMANQAWASKVLGDADLARVLSANLGDDQMSELYDAAQNVGAKTVDKILQGLARGDLTFDEAVKNLKVSQPLDIPVDLDTEAIDRGFVGLNEKYKTSLKIPADVEINSDTTVAEFKRLMGDPELSEIDINGSLTLTEAYATSREFQLWAAEQQIDMYLGANDTPAKLTANALIAYANGQIAEVQLDALPQLAEGQLWDYMKLVDGNTAFVPLDADGRPAQGKLAQVVDQAGNTVGTISIDANDSAASSVANRWNGRTVGTAYINLQAIDSVRVPSQYGSGSMWANGGVVSYYANGGVRESHVAQIAPAGTNRVWAEPETGGEAYIPLSRTKRLRSTAILQNVAERFGYSLVRGNGAAKYANGGDYYAQAARRMNANNAQSGAAFGSGGLTTADKQFLSHVLRTVVVNADGQRITGLTNNINERNARFGR